MSIIRHEVLAGFGFMQLPPLGGRNEKKEQSPEDRIKDIVRKRKKSFIKDSNIFKPENKGIGYPVFSDEEHIGWVSITGLNPSSNDTQFSFSIVQNLTDSSGLPFFKTEQPLKERRQFQVTVGDTVEYSDIDNSQAADVFESLFKTQGVVGNITQSLRRGTGDPVKKINIKIGTPQNYNSVDEHIAQDVNNANTNKMRKLGEELKEKLNDATARYGNIINNPAKFFALDLRKAACETIEIQLKEKSLGQLPNPDFQVTDEVLAILSARLPLCFEKIQEIGREMVDKPDANSPFERFLSQEFERYSSLESLDFALYQIRYKNTGIIQAERASETIIPAYLRLLRDKYKEKTQQNPTLAQLRLLAKNSQAIIKRPAHGLQSDVILYFNQTTNQTTSEDQFIFNIDDFELMLDNKRVIYSKIGLEKLKGLPVHGRRESGVTGCPALPNLIPALIEKSVTEPSLSL